MPVLYIVPSPSFTRRLAALALFGVSFGYVEAAVVVYLRAIYDPVRARLHPARSAVDLFPLITIGQLRASGPENVRRLATEVGREAATILMLAAAALAVSRGAREWLAAFVLAFGVWDIAFYLSLKLLIGWPASLAAWDLLFLIPVPWAAPVLAPLLVSLTMVVGGTIVLWREHRGPPATIEAVHWIALAMAGCALIASFTWDYRHWASGGLPRSFPWWLFAIGEALGLAALASALARSKPGVSQPQRVGDD